MWWEIVKSKLEKIVADTLFELWIEYQYEKELIIDWKKVSNPDFFLPKYNLWLEIWWLHKNEDYKKNNEI